MIYGRKRGAERTWLMPGDESTLVQMLKAAGVATTPRTTLAIALAAGGALTALYAASNGLLRLDNAFDLIVAVVAVAAAGAGIHAAANAEVER